jgi:ubiquinol-cytochrome c reductase cytochrome b subunit
LRPAQARGMSRLRLIEEWIDARTGLFAAGRAILQQSVPGGPAWFHALGSMAAFLLVLEFVTGVFLSFYYAPSATAAWASVAFIQDELTMGWFVRGLHSFGASALIVVTGLHLLQVLVTGAYRAPRELNWIVGVVLLLLVVVSTITGYGLPWDQKGYWAKLVETGIVGQTPLLGGLLEKVAQGGGAYGNYTVTHFYAVHVFLLPAGLIALVALHLRMVFRHRLTPRWSLSDLEASRLAQPYFPAQAFRDAIGSTVVMLVVVTFVVARKGANLEAPADPGSGYMARPEWYAVPLYQLRKYFEGPLEMVATMIIPGLAGGLVAALPFLDRGPDRHPARRLPVMAAALVAVVGMGVLTAIPALKDLRDPTFQKHREDVAHQAIRARSLARRGVLPEGGTAVWKNDPDYDAQVLFKDRCATCHALTGEGGSEGPDFREYNSRAWLTAFLHNPYGPRFFEGAKKPKPGSMKPVEGTTDEVAALVEFVYAQSAAADIDEAMAKHGEALFSDKNCDACHEIDGKTDARGPNLRHRGTMDYVRRIITDSSAPVLYGERAKMPKFAGKLSTEQIERLARFVLKQRVRK